jgi:hypothetical protein
MQEFATFFPPHITFEFRPVLLSRARLGCSPLRMHMPTESVLARVGQQLSQLEKRDWELWAIVSLTGVLVGTGLLAVLFPRSFHEARQHSL